MRIAALDRTRIASPTKAVEIGAAGWVLTLVGLTIEMISLVPVGPSTAHSELSIVGLVLLAAGAGIGWYALLLGQRASTDIDETYERYLEQPTGTPAPQPVGGSVAWIRVAFWATVGLCAAALAWLSISYSSASANTESHTMLLVFTVAACVITSVPSALGLASDLCGVELVAQAESTFDHVAPHSADVPPSVSASAPPFDAAVTRLVLDGRRIESERDVYAAIARGLGWATPDQWSGADLVEVFADDHSLRLNIAWRQHQVSRSHMGQGTFSRVVADLQGLDRKLGRPPGTRTVTLKLD